MKKKLLFLTFIFGLILYPKSAFAEEMNYFEVPKISYYYSGLNTIVQMSANPQYLNGFPQVYGGKHQTNKLFYGFKYVYNAPSLKQKTHYKVQFSFLTYNFLTSYLNPYIFTIHTADFYTASCFAQTSFNSNYNVLLQSGQYGNKANFTNVICDDFYFEGADFYVGVNGIFETSSNSESIWGISKVTFQEISDVSAAISQQTEETKKQTEEIKKQTDATKEQTETIKDNDTTEASDKANSFFNDFEDDDYGLSDIIAMPLQFVESMSDSTCHNLEIPVPFVNQQISLPCMSKIYEEHFSLFLSLYRIITTGIIAYWSCINMFKLVKGFKDPDSDEIEVLDL